VKDVVVDGSDNVIAGGSYYGSVDFNPATAKLSLPTSNGAGFIAKLSPARSLLWAQQAGSGGVQSLALDANGSVYAVGVFTQQADFDPTTGSNVLLSNGSTDIFVMKFNGSGAYQWAVSAGGSGQDWGRGVAVDNLGNVLVTGIFRDTVDFDPSLASYTMTAASDQDGFVWKLNQT
jgi:hypothetical protein